MNYWIGICNFIKYLPGLYVIFAIGNPLLEYLYLGKYHEPSTGSLVFIVLLGILQILFYLYLKVVLVSKESLMIVEYKKQRFLSWNEIESIDRTIMISPVTYRVVPKEGRPFFFFTPEISFHIGSKYKILKTTSAIIEKVKRDRGI
ncbi:hypothetical protein [Spirochaeta cellobiosiphila]|uniref:hypothetical protein n=1 Tax=Spirochaeta cellobiosiphila TaxID=504483 RepID=UPI001B7F82CA|nr:hypothetical protein [Spirochaeta cellobiosiphila]